METLMARSWFRELSAGLRKSTSAVWRKALVGMAATLVAFAGLVFLLSIVVLAWPARPKQVALTPALSQGDS